GRRQGGDGTCIVGGFRIGRQSGPDLAVREGVVERLALAKRARIQGLTGDFAEADGDIDGDGILKCALKEADERVEGGRESRRGVADTRVVNQVQVHLSALALLVINARASI